MKRSIEQLIRLLQTGFSFSGETCAECGETINLVIPCISWHCSECEHKNAVLNSAARKLHEHPSFGNSASEIEEAKSQS